MGQKHGLHERLTTLPELKRAKMDAGGKSEELDDLSTGFENKGYVQGPLDPVFGQRRAFPVRLDLAAVDLAKAPASAEEYLAQVRAQANAIGDGADGSGSDDEFVYYKAGACRAHSGAAGGLLVPAARQAAYLAEFRQHRDVYGAYRAQLAELDAIELPQTAKQWKSFVWEVSCEREYVAQIVEEGQDRRLLVYLTKWLSLNVDDNYEKWLFALLAAFDEVLTAADVSLLRQLGKKARKQLQHQPGPVYERVLAIVGGFYKQKDLLAR